MRQALLLFLCFMTLQVTADECPPLLDVEVRTLNGSDTFKLCDKYKGKVLLVVNTASKCGFTGQYAELEGLYERHRKDGLVVLGFPSNDFGGQEPGTEKQIQQFCVNTYAVKFPMFQKTRVKPPGADALYEKLGSIAGYPRWNFHKYLIDRNGELVDSFVSSTSPYSGKIMSAVNRLLEQ